jgi:Flp pilus assembly pilin Flp
MYNLLACVLNLWLAMVNIAFWPEPVNAFVAGLCTGVAVMFGRDMVATFGRTFLNDEGGATSVEYALIGLMLLIAGFTCAGAGLFFYLMGVGVGAW